MGENRTCLVDSHCHLQDDALRPHLDGVLSRARDAGVTAMVCNATRPCDWQAVADLADRYEQIIPSLGLHPWFVTEAAEGWADDLADRLRDRPAGVGEIGLDRWVEPRDEEAQEEAFRIQMHLARELDRPVMVHCLRAWGWLTDVLADVEPPPAGMLIHAYGGSAEMVDELARFGAMFSFAGNVLLDRKHKQREALASVPADRLLIETDAPDMPPPEPYRTGSLTDDDGKPLNEPANLSRILDGIADTLQQDPDELARQLADNARRFFGPIWPDRREREA